MTRRPPHPSPLPKGRGGRLRLSPKEGASVRASPLPSRERDRVRGDLDDALRRALFLSEALRPAPATAEWAPFIETLRQRRRPARRPGFRSSRPRPSRTRRRDCAHPARKPRNPGQTAALVTPSESLIARVRHALAQWGLAAEAPGRCAARTRLRRAPFPAPQAASPRNWRSCCGWRKGRMRPSIWRAAEIIDLGVLRQMWRPSALAGHSGGACRARSMPSHRAKRGSRP